MNPARFSLEVGVVDATSRYTNSYGEGPLAYPKVPQDELGITWESETGVTSTGYIWQGDPLSLSIARYDVYYCDGRESQFFRNPNQPLPQSTEYKAMYGPMSVFLTQEETFDGPPFGVNADNDPVGHAHETFYQYRDTRDTFRPTTECNGHYLPDETGATGPDFRTRVTRWPVSRAYGLTAAADWNALRNSDRGHVNLTWGHVYTRYEYSFKIEALAAGCGYPGGCGYNIIGLAWTLIPEEKQKTKQTVWGYNWCYSGSSEC
jgi:hypothetical protein